MKKVLKYTGAVILILVVVFFSAGLIFPTVTYETKVTINKPVEATFGAFTNSLKIIEWVPGLVGIGWVSGTQNEAGSKWLFIIKIRGEKYEMNQILNAIKKNELFSITTTCEMFSSDVDVKFVNKGSSTELVATSKLTGTNWFWRSVFFFAQPMLTGQDEDMYNKFKEVAEK